MDQNRVHNILKTIWTIAFFLIYFNWRLITRWMKLSE